MELFCAASVAVAVLLARSLRASVWGGRLALVRSSHPAAESLGISIIQARLVVYTLSALLAGYAGAVYPHIDGYLGPGSFPLSQSILLLAGPIIGGMAVLSGPIVGTALLLLIPLIFVSFVQYSLIIYGAVLIVVTLLLPAGIVPTLADLTSRVGRGRYLPGAQPPPVGSAPDSSPTPLSLPPLVTRLALLVENVSKSFGGLVALDDVTISAEPGEITAVIGPNGSGKTTLLNVLSGFYRPTSGTVILDRRNLVGRRPFRVARSGLARTFQVAHIPGDQTVLGIVATGCGQVESAPMWTSMLRLPKARRLERQAVERAELILGLVGMSDHSAKLGSELTVGQQRLVELARCLATGNPILLLDEPAAGLVGEEVDRLAELLINLKELGYTILIIDHHVELVMQVASRVVVLNLGSVIASGDPASVKSDPGVITAYLGTGLNTDNTAIGSVQPAI
jgi:branched-chain amino acid transport system permease protein